MESKTEQIIFTPQEVLQANQLRINERIASYCAEERQKISTQRTLETENIFLDLLEGSGHRVRGVLCMEGYYMLGGKDDGTDEKAALATEIMHAGMLVQDDIHDNSKTRRGPGRQTMHEALAQSALSKGWENPRAVAENVSSLFAQEAHNKALKIIAEDMESVPSAVRLEVLNMMSDMMLITGEGQREDIAARSNPVELSELEINTLMEKKTPHYSVRYPFMMGMVLAGQSTKEADRISEYAMDTGVAFQLLNDLKVMMPYTEDSQLDDLRNNNRTLLVYYAKHSGRANREDKDFMLSQLGNPSLGDQELCFFQEIFRRTGAINKVQDQIEMRTERAVESLEKAAQPSWAPQSVEMLRFMCQAITKQAKDILA